jgi:hypothetical protein
MPGKNFSGSLRSVSSRAADAEIPVEHENNVKEKRKSKTGRRRWYDAAIKITIRHRQAAFK